MKTGASTFLICLLHGRTSAPTVFSFLATSRRHSSTLYHPRTLSVQKHSKGNVRGLSLLLWCPLTPIKQYSLTVSTKKSPAFNLRTHMSKSALPNIEPSELKGPLAQSLQCVFLLLKRTRCLTPSMQNQELLHRAIMRTGFGPSLTSTHLFSAPT